MFNKKIIINENFPYGGTGVDGELNVTTNTTITGGEKNYTSVTVAAGVTLTISSNCLLRVQNTFTNNGTIVISPCGGSGGTAGYGSSSAGGVGYGGYGGGNGGAGAGSSTEGGAGGVASDVALSISEFIGNYENIKGAGGGGGGGYYYYG